MTQRGYTLVELLIAMAVFSAVLLITSVGILAVLKVQQNGLASRNTQQNGRFALEDMVRTIRTASAVVADQSVQPNTLCLTLPSMRVKYYVDSATNVLRKAEIDTTDPAACSQTPTGVAITSSDVVVSALTTTPVGANPISLELVLTISTPQASGGVCSGTSGSFCATTTFTSAANLRGAQ